MAGKPSRTPILERLLARRTINTSTGCWLWRGACVEGYGVVGYEGGRKLVHRISYELHKGEIPSRHSICHTCDTPACFNPDHLFAGTQRQNMQDAKAKGRTLQGESSSQHILTEAQVIEISELYATGMYTQTELGTRYGVTHTTIGNIALRQRWTHIELNRVSKRRRRASLTFL